MSPFFRKPAAAVARCLRDILSSGLDSRSLVLTLCVGVAMGVMPLLWGTTLLCIITARILRLNQGVLQAVNYLCYPLQIVLLLPFCRMGIWLFPWGPTVPPQFLGKLLHGEITGGVYLLVMVTLKALLAWLVVAPPAALLGYQLLKDNCHRILSRQ